MHTYKGSCHCKAVTYEVTADFTEALDCNCSHCHSKGLLLAFVPDEQFTLLSGKDAQTMYHFNKHIIDHGFCKMCGVESYAHGHDGNGNYMTAINLNCLEDFDLSTIKIVAYDGKHM